MPDYADAQSALMNNCCWCSSRSIIWLTQTVGQALSMLADCKAWKCKYSINVLHINALISRPQHKLRTYILFVTRHGVSQNSLTICGPTKPSLRGIVKVKLRIYPTCLELAGHDEVCWFAPLVVYFLDVLLCPTSLGGRKVWGWSGEEEVEQPWCAVPLDPFEPPGNNDLWQSPQQRRCPSPLPPSLQSSASLPQTARPALTPCSHYL